MGVLDIARLASLLVRASRYPAPAPIAIESPDRKTGAGAVYDLYEPHGQPLAAVIAVHGAVMTGRKDTRLAHLARCLAGSGMICAAPTLPGLARFDFDEGDVTTLESVIEELHARFGQVGIAAFSWGGSYSLVAASRPATAPRVRFVLAIGAAWSFPDLCDSRYEKRTRPLGDGRDLDDAIYVRMAMAYRRRERLGLDPEACSSLEDILRRYCCEASLEEKRAFHDRFLRDLDVDEVDRRFLNRRTLEAISPAGKLGGLRCRVGLVHDRGDNLVPVSHSERIHAELLSLPNARDHRLHVTSLLSHVSPSRLPSLGDALGVARAIYPLVTGD
ncbi:MAG: alpha/beta hydrolase [Deltaproteobacteria bacterium]|nr:alpha/beta hydrolase [Deltaproteobacteria bacterium]